MGATGSITAKAIIRPILFSFTKWDKVDVMDMMGRATKQLSEIFATRKKEFDFLLGGYLKPDDDPEKMDWKTLKTLYREVFMVFQTRKGICDKFEVLCSIILLSGISSEMKIKLFFEIFNFNSKGYLLPTEIQMLIQCVAAGAHKMDPQLPHPSRELIDRMIQSALDHYASEKGVSIRKPEFISFAAETREIQSFMDAWRGHASQVMTGGNKLWEDPYFAAGDSSIVPSRDWLSVGLPPRGFIRWQRLCDVNGIEESFVGCRALFNHSLTFFRDVTKNPVYSGSGCIARGYLQQGYLADRYIMNALAVLISRPQIVEKLFTTTEQENIGRYQVKFFEGGGWRSVFIDDRIPCNEDNSPAFLHSSDPYEGWPLLVEKALSKYFGSYGQLSVNSARHDNILITLRLLTGGHVFRRCTYDFMWKSADQTFLRIDGYRYLKSLLDEGSVVALGRSEIRAIEKPVPMNSMGGNTPHGQLFPLVFITEPNEETSYRYLILRDAWNVMVSEDDTNTHEPEEESGHFRTFTIRLEDVVSVFDYMMVCRYPDVIRSSPRKPPSKLKLRGAKTKQDIPLWNTEILFAKTYGPTQPARFRLIVYENDALIAAKKAHAIALAEAKAAEEEAAALVSAVNDRKKVVIVLGKPKEEEKKTEVNMFDTSNNMDTEYDRLVDVALTVSSAVDWVVAGDEYSAAETRLRVIPTGPTLAAMRESRINVFKTAQETIRKRAAVARMIEAGPDDPDEYGHDGPATSNQKNGLSTSRTARGGVSNNRGYEEDDSDEEEENRGGKSGGVGDVSAFGSEDGGTPRLADTTITTTPKRKFASFAQAKQKGSPTGPLASVKGSPQSIKLDQTLVVESGKVDEFGEPIEEDDPDPEVDTFDKEEVYSYCTQGSWLSTDFLKLLPGTYYVYADVAFALSSEELRTNLKIRGDNTDKPWKEDSGYGVSAVWLEGTCKSRFHLELLTEEESTPSALEQALRLPDPPSIEKTSITDGEDSVLEEVTNEEIEGYQKRLEKAEKKGDDAAVIKAETKLKAAQDKARELLKLQRAIEAKKAEDEALAALEAERKDMWRPVDVEDMEVPEAHWPFMCEIQSDAATRGLTTKLSTLRKESEQLAAQFVEAAQLLKEAKNMLPGKRKNTVALRPNE